MKRSTKPSGNTGVPATSPPKQMFQTELLPPRASPKQLRDAALTFPEATGQSLDSTAPRLYANLSSEGLAVLADILFVVECVGLLPQQQALLLLVLLENQKAGFAQSFWPLRLSGCGKDCPEKRLENLRQRRLVIIGRLRGGGLLRQLCRRKRSARRLPRNMAWNLQ